jgi:hypothetical protein
MILLQEFTEQAAVTNWPARIGLVAATIAFIALALWGMRKGWLHREARQSDIPAPLDVPPGADLDAEGASGLYLGTAVHGDWTDRVVVHDLGVRSRAGMVVSQSGVWLRRVGARSLFIPGADLVALRIDRGPAGTVRAKDSVIVLTWNLGDRTLDTGFRADESSAHEALLDGLMSAHGLAAS